MIDYGDVERSPEDPLWTLAVNKESGIKYEDPNEIYLIDHALTYKADNLRTILVDNPLLLNRLSIMMGITYENMDKTALIKSVMEQIWRFCNTYNVVSGDVVAEDRVPIWYVMDELGSGVLHSDEPNTRLCPFIHLPNGITYSLLFPLNSIEFGQRLGRDFVEGIDDEMKRLALLLPWKKCDFTDESFDLKEPDVAYFQSGRTLETLPDLETVAAPLIDGNRPLKVYSDYDMINKYLTDPCFEIVKDRNADADVFWYTTHFKGYQELGHQFPNKFVNQFPSEQVLLVKDMLSIICRRAGGKAEHEAMKTNYPKWFPETFNLKTELIEFVSYFQNREAKNLDNHWILKPWNMARSLDTSISRNLNEILKSSQTVNPKIAQKYIENPVLFERPEIGNVKFDFRYVILLKNVEDLEVYIYKNFFLRFSNKPFILDDFDSYETHFTVMNYGENLVLKHLKCDEFLEQFKEQNPNNDWEEIEDKVCEILRELFVAATKEKPPRGIGISPQSRGLYAIDVMLALEDGEMLPKLLEVNFMPDCKRACEYYPDFYNDIFKLLFLEDNRPELFRRI